MLRHSPIVPHTPFHMQPEEVILLTARQEKILDTLTRLVPCLNDWEQERLLSFIEGMAAVAQLGTRDEAEKPK